MADGRILSKRISKSDKVANLSSDTARMIYSWIIPYLDVDGPMEANTRLMKGEIAPLLDHITPEKIQEILIEFNSAGLIILYEVENKQYLQLIKFDENQPNLRKDREKKSIIPTPPDKKKTTPAKLRQNSGEAPAELPHKINIREVNIREANTREEEKPSPVDNSKKESSSEKPEAQLQELQSLVNQIQEKYPKLPIFKFIQTHNKDHSGAMVHTLKSLLAHEIKVPDPPVLMKYLETTIKIENGKYNAMDEERKCNEFKRDGNPMEALIGMISNIGKQMPAVGVG